MFHVAHSMLYPKNSVQQGPKQPPSTQGRSEQHHGFEIAKGRVWGGKFCLNYKAWVESFPRLLQAFFMSNSKIISFFGISLNVLLFITSSHIFGRAILQSVNHKETYQLWIIWCCYTFRCLGLFVESNPITDSEMNNHTCNVKVNMNSKIFFPVGQAIVEQLEIKLKGTHLLCILYYPLWLFQIPSS